MAIPIHIMIKALKESKGIIALAAENLGVTRQALYKRISKNEKLKEALHQAIETNIDFAENKLLKQINADYFPALKFYLSTRGRHRGYDQKQQVEDLDKYEINIDFKVKTR